MKYLLRFTCLGGGRLNSIGRLTRHLVLHVLVTSLHAIHEAIHLTSTTRSRLLSGTGLAGRLLGLGTGLVGAGQSKLVRTRAGSGLVHTSGLSGNTLAMSGNFAGNSLGGRLAGNSSCHDSFFVYIFFLIKESRYF